MVYPQPKYREHIQPETSARGVNLSDEENAIKVYEAVLSYMADNSYIFHKSSQNRGRNSYDQISGITPDSVIIQSCAETKMGSRSFHTERVPVIWEIDVFSFATPVDKVKKDLVQRIKEAAKK